MPFTALFISETDSSNLIGYLNPKMLHMKGHWFEFLIKLLSARWLNKTTRSTPSSTKCSPSWNPKHAKKSPLPTPSTSKLNTKIHSESSTRRRTSSTSTKSSSTPSATSTLTKPVTSISLSQASPFTRLGLRTVIPRQKMQKNITAEWNCDFQWRKRTQKRNHWHIQSGNRWSRWHRQPVRSSPRLPQPTRQEEPSWTIW